MQPTGTLSVTGLAATSTFARGLLDRWKVQPVFFAREVRRVGGRVGGWAGEQARQGAASSAAGRQRLVTAQPNYLPACLLLHATCFANPACQEYKSAASFILNKSSSRAEREALTSTLRSLSGQVVRGIAAGRGLAENPGARSVCWLWLPPSLQLTAELTLKAC